MESGRVGLFGPAEASVAFGDQERANGVQGAALAIGDYGPASSLSFDGGDSEVFVLGIDERPAAL